MKPDLKPTFLFDSGYIALSERLREELELIIAKAYTQNRFNRHLNNHVMRFEDTAKGDLLCAYLLSKVPKDCVLSGKLLKGIKIWFNMHYDDRLSVMDKFRTCYQSVTPLEGINERPVITIAFCKFLINELLGTLAENRWQNLVRHGGQGPVNLYD